LVAFPRLLLTPKMAVVVEVAVEEEEEDIKRI
jgi:hypothetical protein